MHSVIIAYLSHKKSIEIIPLLVKKKYLKFMNTEANIIELKLDDYKKYVET